MYKDEIDTPALIVDINKLKNNIKSMDLLAREHERNYSPT